jgi:hypothetical protein
VLCTGCWWENLRERGHWGDPDVDSRIILRWIFRKLEGVVARIVVCTGCWWGNLRERGHWGDPDVDGRIILRWIFSKWNVGVWTGLGWLRIQTDGRHF